jgi:serine/threonine-protein kinase
VVPKVQGGTLSAAEAALQRVHLSYRVQRTSSAAPAGTLLGTTPAAGTTWPQTKPVAILVSAGVSVPNFVGMNVTAVQQWASQNGANLQQQPTPAQSTQQQPGTITGQQPAPGSPYAQGETITVQVVPQDTPTPIPSPDGLTAPQATALLESAGFQVTVTRTGPGNRVWYYSPSGQAPAGSTITIFVGF